MENSHDHGYAKPADPRSPRRNGEIIAVATMENFESGEPSDFGSVAENPELLGIGMEEEMYALGAQEHYGMPPSSEPETPGEAPINISSSRPWMTNYDPPWTMNNTTTFFPVSPNQGVMNPMDLVLSSARAHPPMNNYEVGSNGRSQAQGEWTLSIPDPIFGNSEGYSSQHSQPTVHGLLRHEDEITMQDILARARNSSGHVQSGGCLQNPSGCIITGSCLAAGCLSQHGIYSNNAHAPQMDCLSARQIGAEFILRRFRQNEILIPAREIVPEFGPTRSPYNVPTSMGNQIPSSEPGYGVGQTPHATPQLGIPAPDIGPEFNVGPAPRPTPPIGTHILARDVGPGFGLGPAQHATPRMEIPVLDIRPGYSLGQASHTGTTQSVIYTSVPTPMSDVVYSAISYAPSPLSQAEYQHKPQSGMPMTSFGPTQRPTPPRTVIYFVPQEDQHQGVMSTSSPLTNQHAFTNETAPSAPGSNSGGVSNSPQTSATGKQKPKEQKAAKAAEAARNRRQKKKEKIEKDRLYLEHLIREKAERREGIMAQQARKIADLEEKLRVQRAANMRLNGLRAMTEEIKRITDGIMQRAVANQGGTSRGPIEVRLGPGFGLVPDQEEPNGPEDANGPGASKRSGGSKRS